MSTEYPNLRPRQPSDSKDVRSKVINLKMTQDEHTQLKVLSEIGGTKVATLLHNLIVKQIEDNKEAIQMYIKAQENLRSSGAV